MWVIRFVFVRFCSNLIGNAVKFTGEGHILISLEGEPLKENTWHFCIAVQDTGIGIPADKQESIFERFVQASSDTNRLFGGTGLGLHIVQALVTMMNGSIQLISRDGEGSIFRIEFELETSGAPPFSSLTKRESIIRNDCRPLHQRIKIFWLVSFARGAWKYLCTNNWKKRARCWRENLPTLCLLMIHIRQMIQRNSNIFSKLIEEQETASALFLPIGMLDSKGARLLESAFVVHRPFRLESLYTTMSRVLNVGAPVEKMAPRLSLSLPSNQQNRGQRILLIEDSKRESTFFEPNAKKGWISGGYRKQWDRSFPLFYKSK